MFKSVRRHTYAGAGVDIDAGLALVDAIKPLAKSTNRPGADTGLSGFGAFFDLKKTGYKDPILVAGADGVGSKLRIATQTRNYDTIGIDLVAMCVNDIVVHGAEPLFFLDYFAMGKLDTAVGEKIIGGIAEGCCQAHCALIGGETAEMPRMYHDQDFDLAGFAVGIVERNEELTGKNILEGDVILGLASSGLHANGFSLVRQIVDDLAINYNDRPNFSSRFLTIGDALLVPTNIYVEGCLKAARTKKIKAYAHITGGGLRDNVLRILPDDCAAIIDVTKWEHPPVFSWLSKVGKISNEEMIRTFNCGIGMVVIVSPSDADRITEIFRDAGETVCQIGSVAPRNGGQPVQIQNLERLWAD